MLRKIGFYEKYITRLLDILCALLAMAALSWLYLLVAVLVRLKMGKPVLYKQPRPGMIDPKTGKERIFDMYKFRSMTDERDEQGNLLPDEKRLSPFGRMLRATSLDEIPEAINILKGEMSVVGPRPQLVRDMGFMSDEQRMRHTAKPGLSGLAQVMGRNSISWEDKINWYLKYIENVSLLSDLKIVLLTVKKAFFRGKKDDDAELEVTDDYGDALLKAGKISREQYDQKQAEARALLAQHEGNT